MPKTLRGREVTEHSINWVTDVCWVQVIRHVTDLELRRRVWAAVERGQLVMFVGQSCWWHRRWP